MSRICTGAALLLLSLLGGAGAVDAQSAFFTPTVRAITATVGTASSGGQGTDVHYCIYFGDAKTAEIDETTGKLREQRALMLVHPVAEGMAWLHPAAPHRWYVVLRGGARAAPVARLLLPEVWPEVPAPARHALAALGVDDPDLILISFQLVSGSMSVYYHPRFDRDREFYEARLLILQRYAEMHDLCQDLPLGNVVHLDTGAS